ncbi:DUF4917 family protein [Paraburkholderia graminis]
MAFEIKQWNDIADKYSDAIILGNGASVAVSNTFSYSSLLGHAVKERLISGDVQLIFDFFKTKDFELVLRTVWQATNINAALKIEDERTKAAYLNVRESLIRAVREVHPQHAVVAERLPAINEFLKRFKTVFSLNYDLIVYWTMMYGFRIDDHHSFKDCFLDKAFADEWERLREPIRGDNAVTLVFYPHGSLALCRTKLEQERKIHGGEEGLLDAILARWETEQVVPLFVSEGTSEQKVSSIRGSFYLSTVYREVLRAQHPSLTIYGWSLGEHDMHILERLKTSGVKHVAVSVYQNRQADCAHAERVIADALGANVEVEFFDSASDGCWINPP